MKTILSITGIALVMVVGMSYAGTLSTIENTTNHEHNGHDHEHSAKTNNSARKIAEHASSEDVEPEQKINLTAEKLELANIQVKTLQPRAFINKIYAPGELKANGYKSYLVSPRTDSVVIRRHASLGDHVEVGQKLVTLFSETMAQAQAEFLIASSNWHRSKKLGKQTVSESMLVESENIYKATRGKLIAYGLTPEAITKITSQDNATFGQYSLIAERDGVVLQDDFMQGQRVAAGETIMLLANENELWVEANIPPNKHLDLRVNSPAIIELDGAKYPAKVIQEAHTIDPVTRTRIVRLSVENKGHNLHSGMFVKVFFHFKTNDQVMAVSEEALIRDTDGDWTVFVESSQGEFEQVIVTLGESLGEYRQVFGLTAGTKIVNKGTFFVASEMAKGGFDPHNH